MILKHFIAGASVLRHAASVPESGIRNKLNLNADDDCPEGAEALKEANFCKKEITENITVHSLVFDGQSG